MIRIAVCDDEIKCLTHIKDVLSKYNKYEMELSLFQSPYKLLECDKEFDIIILDIDMPGLNGMEAAKNIRDKDKQVKLIYLTNYSDYTMFAFQVHAFAYLLKPVKPEELYKQLDEVAVYFEPVVENVIEFDTDEGIKRLASNEILYFEYFNRKVILHTVKGLFHIKCKISDIGYKMAEYDFAVPHKSFVVNLYHVISIKGYEVQLSNNEIIPLSQKKSVEFRKSLTLYLGGRKLV